MNMAVENTLFRKRASHLVTNESGQSKIQVDFLQKKKPKESFERYNSLT